MRTGLTPCVSEGEKTESRARNGIPTRVVHRTPGIAVGRPGQHGFFSRVPASRPHDPLRVRDGPAALLSPCADWRPSGIGEKNRAQTRTGLCSWQQVAPLDGRLADPLQINQPSLAPLDRPWNSAQQRAADMNPPRAGRLSNNQVHPKPHPDNHREQRHLPTTPAIRRGQVGRRVCSQHGETHERLAIVN